MRDFAKCKQFLPYDSSHMQYLLLCFEPVIYNKREWESFFSLVYNQWFIHAVNCRAGVIFLVYSSNGYELSPYYWSCGWELRQGLLSWKEAKESQEALRTKCIHNSLVTLQGHPTTIFGKISVRKTIWDLEFSEHLLQNFLLACFS